MLSPQVIEERIKERLVRLGRPTTEKDLLKQLRLKGESRRRAKDVLADMLRRGVLVSTRTDRIGLPERMDLVRGRLEMKRGGFGFVVPSGKDRTDVYVATHDLADALHGDEVLVHIDRRGEGGRPEGHIVKALERRTTRIVGRLSVDAGGTRLVPFDPHVFYEVFIPDKDLMGAQPGDMIAVELTRFPTPYRAPTGRIVEVMGSVDEPGVDVRVIIAAHGLRDAFPEEVLAESEAIATDVEEKAIERREDFRDRPIVTIDGETARDFDDAVEVDVLPNGNFRLGVHIADVSHYVRRGSHLDAEALLRGTSVYFPDRAIPMFPERLSNGICSLNPGVDRLVQSVFVEVTPMGRIVSRRFADGVIRSAARMTYTKVRQILVDRDPEVMGEYESLVPHFERMAGLFKILRARRAARGSIDFDRPEAEIELDESGRVVDIRVAERNVAHRIIEEFMLLANEVVATFLEEQSTPALYRVHDPPDEDRVEKFEEFLSGLGHRLRVPSEALHPRAFQRLLSRIEGKPEERLISYVMLRAMKQAVYSEENRGHYALAASRYTHFTSPIRRYPDLVVHRILRELREKGPPQQSGLEERAKWLRDVAESTSISERRADEAERELEDWKKVRFMVDKVGDVYPGVVTGVTRFGLYVELVDYFIEGLVHMSTLVDDYYHYHEDTHTLRGDSRGRVFRLGDRVDVKLARVDLNHRQIDFAIEGIEPTAKKRAPKRSRPSKGGGRRKNRR
ncbi:MAG TPA: ribonuclease R [Vicinamibacteria bacterium]|nr:ribonuclease R [Vicinamibacteria bacterium]